jgi:hypothetical protein
MSRRAELCYLLEELRAAGRREDDPDMIAFEDELIQMDRGMKWITTPADLMIIEEPLRSTKARYVVEINFEDARTARLAAVVTPPSPASSRSRSTTPLPPFEQAIEDVADNAQFLSSVRQGRSDRVRVKFTEDFPSHFLYNSLNDMLLDVNRYTVAQFNRFSVDTKHGVLLNNYRWLVQLNAD